MDLDQTSHAIGLALGLLALLGAFVGFLRWARPRYRTAKTQGAMAIYSLVGRDEVVDPASGRVLAEAQPGIGARMESVENAVVRVVDLIESQQRQDDRIDDHEHRIKQLEDGTIERIAGKAESTAAWRAVEKIAETGGLPDLDADPDDAPELD